MKKTLLAILASLFLCSSAQAYSAGFDVSGLDNFFSILAFQLVEEPELEDTPAGASGFQDLWSYEDALRNFTESFTMNVQSADVDPNDATSVATLGTKWDNTDSSIWNAFYADIDLTGQVVGSTATFFSGDVTMYLDVDGDKDYTAGVDTLVATLELVPYSGQTMALSDTVLDENISGDIDLVFKFTALGDGFWDDDAVALMEEGWYLALLGGKITAAEVITDANGSIVGWDITGIDAELSAIPEPTTMILLGAGLLGLAGISRKKLG